MKTLKWYSISNNTQQLKTFNEEIEVLKGKWVEYQDVNNKITWPIINFERKMNFENPDNEEYVYILKMDNNSNCIHCFIKLDYWENQCFLWSQRKHWLQEKDIYKFLIPTLISMLSLFIAYLAYIKK